MKKYFILVALAFGIISCANEEDAEKSSNKIVYEDYLPFKFVDGEKWGMISPNGKILFTDKYEDSHSVINNDGEIENIDIDISPALNGFFLMTNKYGTKDYYTATKEPKFTFGGFQEAGLFRETVTPTVKKGEWIKFINRKGEVVFDFKEVNGVNVKKVSNFYNGVAIFELEDETYGCIDTKGKVLVNPQSEQISFCQWGDYILENGIITIGNKILNIQKGWEIIKDENCYFSVFSPYSDYFALEVQSDENNTYIIYDSEGRKIKQINYEITDLSGDYYIFSMNNKLGIANLAGDIIMQPSYDAMNFIDYDKVLCANQAYEGLVKILSLTGEVIYQEHMEQPCAYVFYRDIFYKDNMLFFRKRGGNIVIINSQGKIISNEQIERFVDFGSLNNFYDMHEYIHSEYFDSESIIRRIGLTDVGVCGVTPNNTLKDFYDKFSDDIFNDDIRSYIRQNKLLPISLDINGVSLAMYVYFVADIYPNYQLAYNEKPYVIEISITESNFTNSNSYNFLSEEKTCIENIKTLFEDLHKYYCDKYYIMRTEKKENAFYLEIARKNDANSIVVSHDDESIRIAISESDRFLHYYYENLQ